MVTSRRGAGVVLGVALAAAMAATASAPAAGAPPVAPAPSADHPAPGLAERLGAGRPADVHVVREAGSGLVRFVGTRPGRPLARPAGIDGRSRPTEAARAFVQAHGALFGVAGRGRGLGAAHAVADAAGGHVVRLQQEVGGHPVLGGTVSVALTGGNAVSFVAGRTTRLSPVTGGVQVSPGQAREAALAASARAARTTTAALRVTQRPSVMVYDPALVGVPTAARTGLVYRVQVESRSSAAPVRELVLVDAMRGDVVLHADELMEATAEQTVCTAGDRIGVQDPTCPPDGGRGQPTVLSDPSVEQDARDASTYAQSTFDFYRDVVGDTSALGLSSSVQGDRRLNSTVHFCDPTSGSPCQRYENAFWDGHEMVYGDGFSAADDVVAHELTHSVTEHTSGLFYWYQSGAINESMSDVMGELVDQWDGAEADTDNTRWVLGEGLPIGPVRDMRHPGAAPAGAQKGVFVPQPDRMTSQRYFGRQAQDPQTSQAYPEDAGGVHVNSGVGNKAAYLILDGTGGGSFNGVSVRGLGGRDAATRQAAIAKAAKIYYLADESLPSAADYADLAVVLPAACNRLVGTAGITTTDCATVRAAVRATEMTRQPRVAQAPEAPVCGSAAMSTRWFDNLEKPASGRWSRSSAHTAYGPFYYPQRRNPYGNYPIVYATSGVQEIWGDDPEPRAAVNGLGKSLPRDGTIRMSKAVHVPVGKRVYLRFDHAYQFEWYPAGGGYSALYTDGGRVEYSANQGPWRSAAGLFDAGGYNHTVNGLNASGTKRIYRFRGFGGDSHGYVSSRLDLRPLAGKWVRFRFHLTADAAVGASGWFIDDVRFYTCG